ncbi:MAG TPA: efflux RND transporter periplasmic adaptor subunit [Vicinamibacterales bacterium]|jgi:RND family efflux transporter MFP subunit|nr:efflux RND transporter periplasmic adaptor subunit [Vicinamibacterales bacterium]
MFRFLSTDDAAGRGLILTAGCLAVVLPIAACSGSNAPAVEAAPGPKPAVAVSATAAIEQPIDRFIRVTGSLTAEEQAAVAAETAGRVVRTPVERGQRVAAGSELVSLSSAETDAQLKEAEANAAQIAARLGMTSEGAFSPENVPEVQTAKASFALAQSEFNRIQSLLDQRVVSQAEFDQRRTQMDASRQQYEAAKNAAAQLYQSLQAAQARVTLARKALADTTVRAPFDGLVAERTVSVGDYVTKGTKVVTVVRVNPLRVRLTVPEQFVSAVGVGQRVTFGVDAYPQREFEGTVKYVSPALEANQRALTVEAVVPNPDGVLKPGFFATVQVQLPSKTPAILVPVTAVRTSNGTSRVFVVVGDHVEERIVTVGDTLNTQIEITSGLTSGEKVATTHIDQLSDGSKVS